MVAPDRIRLTGPLRKAPASAGAFYVARERLELPALDVDRCNKFFATFAESLPTYRRGSGNPVGGANRRLLPRSAALSARARQLTPKATERESTVSLSRKRHALWALCVLLLAALGVMIASAHAASGGISRSPTGGSVPPGEGASF